MEVCLLTMPFLWILIGLVVGAAATAALFIMREKKAEKQVPVKRETADHQPQSIPQSVFQPNPQQMEVIRSDTETVVVIAGPGTGKTTIINVIIRYLTERGYDFLLAAPTGRAAKRMTEATGYDSSTILPEDTFSST